MSVTAIALDQPLASRLIRLIGQWIDSLIAFAIVCPFLLPLFIDERVGAITVWVGIMGAVLYILLSDGLRGGQSFAKRLLRIAVVDAQTGAPCTFGQSLARNFLLMVLGFIDWVIIFGAKRQRLGDKLAGTKVVTVA